MRKWFASLKIQQKLMLVCIFFVMPDCLMLYFFITSINANIQFAQLEKKGDAYQRPLETLLELIPQHASLAPGAVAGAPGFRQQLAKKEAQIDEAFGELDAVNEVLSVDLQFTDEGLSKRNREHYCVRIVKAEWQVLKASLAQLSPEACASGHLHLIADVRMMITHAGDMSNLILDPQLDSYYLVDVTLLALPQTQDRMAVVTSLGGAILNRRTISNADRRQMAIYATLLQADDLDRINDSLHTSLTANPGFYGGSASYQTRVPPALKEYSAATEHFINLTTRLFSSDKFDMTAKEYVAAGNQARDASFKLWRIADTELDGLLQKRVEYYQHRRARSLIVAGLAVLAAISLVTFITRSITGPLHQQAAELNLANNALETEIIERRRAEAQLRQSEERLAIAQKIARIGSWEWEVSANKLIWSEENYRIHGVKPDEFQVNYEVTRQFIHPDDFAASDMAIKKALQKGKPFSFEQRVIHPDKTTRIIHQRGDVVLGPDGQTTKMFGTAQDITEKKLAEAELEKMHKQLLETSRLAGMAEVATGVLHNVGNVLNSLSVSVTLVGRQLRRADFLNLRRATKLLRDKNGGLGEFLTTNPKGKLLPEFLEAAADQLADDQEQMIAELSLAGRHIEHIKEIVTMQQSYAKVSGAFEHLPVRNLVEDALLMNATALERHQVHVTQEISDNVQEVRVDRHKVLQILINLLSNAKYAMDAQNPATKQLVIRAEMASTNHVRIIVRDNGIGIAGDNLVKIFTSGFTTKKDGHGFGLHSGANAAKEMGGSLTAHSDGLGRGASFILELPVAGRQKAKATAQEKI
jgi:PAS domain S-box-containing protein